MGKLGPKGLKKSRNVSGGGQILNIHPDDKLFCSLCWQPLTQSSLRSHKLSCIFMTNGEAEPRRIHDREDSSESDSDVVPKTQRWKQKYKKKRKGEESLYNESEDGLSASDDEGNKKPAAKRRKTAKRGGDDAPSGDDDSSEDEGNKKPAAPPKRRKKAKKAKKAKRVAAKAPSGDDDSDDEDDDMPSLSRAMSPADVMAALLASQAEAETYQSQLAAVQSQFDSLERAAHARQREEEKAAESIVIYEGDADMAAAKLKSVESPDKPEEPVEKPDKPEEPVEKPDKPDKPVEKPDKPEEPVEKPDKPEEPVKRVIENENENDAAVTSSSAADSSSSDDSESEEEDDQAPAASETTKTPSATAVKSKKAAVATPEKVATSTGSVRSDRKKKRENSVRETEVAAVGGGTPFPFEYTKELREFCREQNLPFARNTKKSGFIALAMQRWDELSETEKQKRAMK
jgi:hypothetical protein